MSSLVAAFSGALGLDYGAYYCVSCKEAAPNNSILAFDKNAINYKKLKGVLSFYRSDFLVYDKWNLGDDKQPILNDLSNVSKLKAPVLVFSGAFNPITPATNGKAMVQKFKNCFLINAPVSGHAPSFSKIGFEIVDEFTKNQFQRPNTKELEANKKAHFVTDIKISKGVSNLANSLNEFNLLSLFTLVKS
ncbi:hypothetical protein C8C82_4228 [Flavobacterium sp. 81]|uniref:alpha/beta fold hydrolase n=1 Tax=unclassified Flavobacterium TaxID=196869 RepID=UPI000F2AADDD|nr:MULTISPECIES: hypothetical protein [unclassified Flavobacterium]RKR04572.1 hypothetical protein C8C82_4228 [Flavobacterium sp. 81]